MDLNADLGELSAELDAAIMPWLTSCNIACGGHAGDRQSIQRTMDLADRYQVAIGAHPGYPDPAHFGRESYAATGEDLLKSLDDQMQLFIELLNGRQLHHIKFHGALYNDAAKDSALADTLLEWIHRNYPEVITYGLPSSELQKACASYKQPFVAEGFADRQYESSGQLRSRKLSGAVLHDTQQVLDQVYELTFNERVSDADGHWLSMPVQTICLHGDTQGAVQLSAEIAKSLRDAGASLAAVE